LHEAEFLVDDIVAHEQESLEMMKEDPELPPPAMNSLLVPESVPDHTCSRTWQLKDGKTFGH
jgi:hypothetical protein